METGTLTKDVEQGKEMIAYHNLLTREIRPDRNWHELMMQWHNAETIDQMLGVLHRGFDVLMEHYQYDEPRYDEMDRLIFYFTIADGWLDNDLLTLPGESREQIRFGFDDDGHVICKSRPEIRRIAARKAFDELAIHFFKKLIQKEGSIFSDRDWNDVVFDEKLFPVIRNYFRAEIKYRDPVIRNLSRWDDKRSHNETLAVNFLLDMVKFIWEWHEKKVETYESDKTREKIVRYNKTMKSFVISAKAWTIELLSYLGKLPMLKKWIFRLDKSSLDKLKEIAMRKELRQHKHPVNKDRPVATLDEACFAGSEAAWLLKWHGLMKSEHNRLNAILEAQWKKEEADRKIAKLSAHKK